MCMLVSPLRPVEKHRIGVSTGVVRRTQQNTCKYNLHTDNSKHKLNRVNIFLLCSKELVQFVVREMNLLQDRDCGSWGAHIKPSPVSRSHAYSKWWRRGKRCQRHRWSKSSERSVGNVSREGQEVQDSCFLYVG